jgi:hypothetical protein
VLGRIQRQLSSVYNLAPTYDITDFVFPLSQVEAPLDRPEQVLVHQTENALELALVLDDQLLVERASWDVGDFCVAVEGVSHMLYLFQVAERDGQVTQLELEMQAEIDKFVLLTFGGMSDSTALQSVFDDVSVRATVVCPIESERYQQAHHLAQRYCQWLGARFFQSTERLLAELRKVYRMVGERKRAYVSGCRP